MNARRATLDVAINGNSIKANLSDEALSFTYTDNLTDQVDDASLSFEDRTGRWVGGWFPAKGDILTARILYDGAVLDCGAFTVDGYATSSPPRTIAIKGLAIPARTGFSEVARSRSWEQATLQEILRSLAEASGIPFQYRAAYDPVLDFVSQAGESDRAFMHGLCGKYGLGLKLYANRAVVYDIEELRNAGGAVVIRQSDVLSDSLETTVVGSAYTGVVVSYTDADGRLVQHRAEIEAEVPKLYHYRTPVGSVAEAIRVAESKLRALNMEEVAGSLSLDGNPLLVAGMCVELRDYGIFSGRYTVTQATHSIGGGGYTTAIKIAREEVQREYDDASTGDAGGSRKGKNQGFHSGRKR